MTAIAPTRLSNTAYWIATAVLATECLGGGVAGMVQVSPFLDTATHLGYPAYFMSILGAWYASAGIVLLAPATPPAQGMGICGSGLQLHRCRGVTHLGRVTAPTS